MPDLRERRLPRRCFLRLCKVNASVCVCVRPSVRLSAFDSTCFAAAMPFAAAAAAASVAQTWLANSIRIVRLAQQAAAPRSATE